MRVEVTVRSLQGRNLLTKNDNNNTALISFGGSCQTMKVASSNISARTGRPVIESERLLPLSIGSNNKNKLVWKTTRGRPHLTFTSTVRSNHPETTLMKVNSRPLAELETSDTNHTTTTAVWETTTMAPEIVEFTIQLGTHMGICYLQFFGNPTDIGAFVLQLPVRVPSCTRNNGSFVFWNNNDATLTVHVQIWQTMDDPPPGVLATSDASSQAASISKDSSLPPLLQQLQDNHSSMGALLDMRRKVTPVEMDRVPPPPLRQVPCSSFGWQSFRHAMRACHGGAYTRTDDTSTIATRDSWPI